MGILFWIIVGIISFTIVAVLLFIKAVEMAVKELAQGEVIRQATYKRLEDEHATEEIESEFGGSHEI